MSRTLKCDKICKNKLQNIHEVIKKVTKYS